MWSDTGYVQLQGASSTTKISNPHVETERFVNALTHSADVITVWKDCIAGLEISQEDRDVLIQSAAMEMMSLRLSYRCHTELVYPSKLSTCVVDAFTGCNAQLPHCHLRQCNYQMNAHVCACRLLTESTSNSAAGEDCIRLYTGVPYPRELVIRVMGSPWLLELQQLSRSLRSLDLDTVGFACLCALILLQGTHQTFSKRKGMSTNKFRHIVFQVAHVFVVIGRKRAPLEEPNWLNANFPNDHLLHTIFS